MARRGFMDGYNTYDPAREGYGSPRQWRAALTERMGLDEARDTLKDRSPYAILGVARTATGKEIVSAFRRAALACHPDRCAVHGLSPDVATERFKALTAAFTILSDAEHRAAYDRSGRM